MKVKLLVVALVVLAMCSLSFGQVMFFFNEAWPMTKNCGSGAPLPVDTKLWIMNDVDGDGPGTCANPDNDPLGTLCAHPTDCEDGPGGTVNRQYFLMGEGSGTAGIFASDPSLYGVALNSPYTRFYLKVVYAETTVTGLDTCVHRVTYLQHTVAIWLPEAIVDVDLGSAAAWDCCVWDTCWSGIPPCTPDHLTLFSPLPQDRWQGGPQHFHDCAKVCANGGPHMVSVGPLVAPNRLPHGYVLPGCDPFATLCDSECPPANGWTFGALVFNLRFVPPPVAQYWYDALIVPLTGATDGCICIVVDFIENVEIAESDVLPLSNSVKITWRTVSETNLEGFAIYRDNVRIATKEAANTASGASYEYLDSDVENGRTYDYDLRSVDVGGTEMSFKTASVTPSFENALVTEYALHQNYPNPFNPSTKIAFDLVENNTVTLTVYNATGQVVATLINGMNYTKGRHAITFDSGRLTSGLYFYSVKIGNEFTATKKMLLVK